MKLLICIDDTDNIESKGTGAIADEIRQRITTELGGECGVVTRHQLLIHPDVPYTSHNSSMCFPCELSDEHYEALKTLCFTHLKTESAEGSDPGLAIAIIKDVNKEMLIAFGLDAKRRVLSKDEAYSTADDAGVYLTEAGGTGQGVVGAVAGIGLRLWGNDGELKGKLSVFKKEEAYSVAELKGGGFIQDIKTKEGILLADDEMIYVKWKAKPTLSNHTFTLFVEETENGWCTMEKSEMRKFLGSRAFEAGCELFVYDVEEERESDEHSCYNCRYRRWAQDGLMCVQQSAE